MNEENLIPVGEECLLASTSEAIFAFSSLGFFGEVTLALAEFTKPTPLPKFYLGPPRKEMFRCIAWVCTMSNNENMIWPAFVTKEDPTIYQDVCLPTKISENDLFIQYGTPYVLCSEEIKDKDCCYKEETIKQIGLILSEKEIISIISLSGLKPISACPKKIYALKVDGFNQELKSSRQLLSIIWQVKCEKMIIDHAVFSDDNIMFDIYDRSTLDKEAISVGQGVIINHQHYILDDDPITGYSLRPTGLSINH